MLAILGQGYAYRVADAVGEKRSNADGALDPPVLAIPGLGHAEMDRIVPIGTLGIQARHEQAVGGDHDLRIGGLHGKNKLVIAEIAGDPGKLKGTFHHTERRIAEAVHDPVTERSVVGSYAHRHPALPTELHERCKTFPDPVNLRLVLGIGVIADVEFLGIGEVARVDTNLLNPMCSFHGGLRLEMDVGDQRNSATKRIQLFPDLS